MTNMFFFSDLRRFRTYKGNSVRDLLRAMRNKVRQTAWNLFLIKSLWVTSESMWTENISGFFWINFPALWVSWPAGMTWHLKNFLNVILTNKGQKVVFFFTLTFCLYRNTTTMSCHRRCRRHWASCPTASSSTSPHAFRGCWCTHTLPCTSVPTRDCSTPTTCPPAPNNCHVTHGQEIPNSGYCFCKAQILFGR